NRETTVSLKLEPLPTFAILSVVGGPAGAEVLVDSQPIGKVSGDGVFSQQVMPPGNHEIRFQRAGQNSEGLRKEFVAGRTTRVSGAEVRLVASATSSTVSKTSEAVKKTEETSGQNTVSLPPAISQRPPEPVQDVPPP